MSNAKFRKLSLESSKISTDSTATDLLALGIDIDSLNVWLTLDIPLEIWNFYTTVLDVLDVWVKVLRASASSTKSSKKFASVRRSS